MRRGMFMMVYGCGNRCNYDNLVVTYLMIRKLRLQKRSAPKAYGVPTQEERNSHDRTEEFKESKRYHNLSLVKIEDSESTIK